MKMQDRLETLRVEAGQAGDVAQVEMCNRALAGDVGAIADCFAVCRAAANAQFDLRAWDVREGDYLSNYWDGEPDPGSRCGWSDSELAKIEAHLSRLGLALLADDHGLVVARLRIEGDT